MLKFFVIVSTPFGWLLRWKRAGVGRSVRRAPELAAPSSIALTSPAFADGSPIPARHASMDLGPNISPELLWAGIPSGTAQLLLIIEDIDVPSRRPGIHTIALFKPSDAGLAEGALTPENSDILYVPDNRDRTGYLGPRALPGHGVHHYGFHLYALDRILPTEPSITDLAQLLNLVENHVLAQGFLEGTQRG